MSGFHRKCVLATTHLIAAKYLIKRAQEKLGKPEKSLSIFNFPQFQAKI
jgi:hypothetical protein